MTKNNVVEQVADKIALQIASGQLRPGDSLPSVRQLAKDHEISASSVQVVLARLRTSGFVEARHGSGIVVRDIRLYGGIETWQYVFRFSRKLPDLALQIVQEVLETLRLFYRDAITKIAAAPQAYDHRPAQRALAQLELLTQADPPAPAGDINRSVIHIIRTIQADLGARVMLGVLNSMEGILTEAPEVLEPLYSQPAEHLWFWGQVITAWENVDIELAEQALQALDDWHTQALARVRENLCPPPNLGLPTSASQRS